MGRPGEVTPNGQVKVKPAQTTKPVTPTTAQPKPIQAGFVSDAREDLVAGLHTSLYLLTRDYSAKYGKDKAVEDMANERIGQLAKGSVASANKAIDRLLAKGALESADADAVKKMIADGKYGDALARVEELLFSTGAKGRLPSEKLKRVPIDILGLAKDVSRAKDANALLISVLDYAAEKKWIDRQAGGKWTSEAELKKNIGGDRLELVREMLKCADASGLDAMKSEFGKLTAADAAGALAEWKALLSKPKEEPGKLDKYADINIFNQDPRAMLMNEQGAMKAPLVDGKFSIAKAEEEFVKNIKGPGAEMVSVKPTDAAIKAGSDLQAITGINKDNALSSMVALGVLWDGKARSDVKKKASDIGKQDVSQEVFGFNGRHYALNHDYAKWAGVPDELVKKEGKEIAVSPLENKRVQEFIRGKVKADLVALGVMDASGAAMNMGKDDAKVVANYLNGGTLDIAVKNTLQRIADEKTKSAEILSISTLAALIAQEADSKGIGFEQAGLYRAIVAKCDIDGNGRIDTADEIARLESLRQSLMDKTGANYRADLKDVHGNLDMGAVQAAIGIFAPGAATPTTGSSPQAVTGGERQFRYGASGVQQGLENRAARALGLDEITQFRQGRRLQRLQGAGGAGETKKTEDKDQATSAQFSTGTWVDRYLKGNALKEYNQLSPVDKQAVLDNIKNNGMLPPKPSDEYAGAVASGILDGAIKAVNENKK
ncbi:MAG: hypothetical protein NTX79_08845 [Candidatus Micrarchaeota archaeon]|nr:hypothetical protein [Candidatus Micrarchaeota archaeon]